MKEEDRTRTNPELFSTYLERWNSGDKDAANEVMGLVYDQLRRIAAAHARRERADHTLQTTAIVHEAYIKIFKNEQVHWRDRAHLLGAAARVMRQVLTDYARRRNRLKRRPEGQRVPFTETPQRGGTPSIEQVLDVDELLARLAEVDERKARIVEAHFFGGMTVDEISGYLGIGRTTVVRDLKLAKAWLHQQLVRRGRGAD